MTHPPTNRPPNPAIGEEVFFGQDLGEIAGDPGHGISGRSHHMVILLDVEERGIAGRWTFTPETLLPSYRPVGPGQKLIYWGKSSAQQPLRGIYLPYPPLDGSQVDSLSTPVNPIPYVRQWRDVLSRFAHDVMEFNPRSNHLRDEGTHTTGHLPPTDAAADLKNKTTYQLSRAVIGVALQRIEKFATLDAEKLAYYPETVPDAENWKLWLEGVIPAVGNDIPIPNMKDMMAYICGEKIREIKGICVGAWVYLLNDRIDASSYNSNMNTGGEIRLPEPSADVWRPSRFLHNVTGSRTQRSDQWDEIMASFRKAHDHYLTSVAPSTEHV